MSKETRFKYSLFYRCGHIWSIEYAKRVKSAEIQQQRELSRQRLCPRCEDEQKLKSAAKSAGAYADMPTLEGGA